jgi:hypothetical protein
MERRRWVRIVVVKFTYHEVEWKCAAIPTNIGISWVDGSAALIRLLQVASIDPRASS